MLANLGFIALVVALGCALYAAVVAVVAAARRRPEWLASARHAALLTWPLITLACGLLIWHLLNNQFQLNYVYGVTSRAMPTYLKVTALWGGQEGSLLFWSWLMATFAGAALLRKWERQAGLMPYVIAVTMITLGFFVALVVVFENPFARLWQNAVTQEVKPFMLQAAGWLPLTPTDGRGLNPLLRHPGMVLHPPMLYTGFVSFVVPYAFAMAALITRRTDDEWIRTTRRWTLVGWLFLSLGLILGGRWAYDVLGWGGYWAWDPVENAALLPWLTGTAFLHSVMIQEKRGMLKKWNLVLIIMTYALVIFGTFLTRSGVLSSVHAFAQSPIGPSFFVFIGVTFITSLLLLFREWDHLRDEHQLDTPFSREGAFLLNNLLFMGIAVSVFAGTVFPMISELVVGEKKTVGPPFYNMVTGPQFAALVLLMGVAPLMPWRRASTRQVGRTLRVPVVVGVVVGVAAGAAAVVTWDVTLTAVQSVGRLVLAKWPALLAFGISAFVAATTGLEFWRGARARMRSSGENALVALLTLAARNRRRYGGYLIHLAVVLMAIGVVGSNFFQRQTQGQLKPGEQLTLGRYVVTFDGLEEKVNDAEGVHTATATVSVYRDGKPVGKLYPHRDFYFEAQQPMTIPGVRSTIEDDLYVLLVTWEPVASDGATFRIYVNPLVNWIWAGGILFILGTLWAAWPDPAEERRRVPARAVALRP